MALVRVTITSDKANKANSLIFQYDGTGDSVLLIIYEVLASQSHAGVFRCVGFHQQCRYLSPRPNGPLHFDPSGIETTVPTCHPIPIYILYMRYPAFLGWKRQVARLIKLYRSQVGAVQD